MRFFHLFKKEDRTASPGKSDSLEKTFAHFTELLKENNETLELMTDLEEKAGGHFLFDMTYLRSTSYLIAEKVGLVVTHLTRIAPDRYEELKEIYERIRLEVLKTLDKQKGIPWADYTIDLGQITAGLLPQTGGKNAHLGEVKNVLGLPTPDGFAVSTYAYIHFLSYNHLQDRILSILSGSPLKDQKTLQKTEEEIKTLILQARVPPDLEAAIMTSARKIGALGESSSGLALRSSAVLEDTHFSFAGQYATFLNIAPEEVSSKYKEIIASQFNARALFYMKSKGIVEEEMVMAVACQNLVPSKSAGVMFTSHFDPAYGEVILINALWGLGKWVVEGTVSPDLFLLDKTTGRLIKQQISKKTKRLTAGQGNILLEEAVPESLQESPSLNPNQLATLWKWARLLESHFHHPQDVEWALDPDGKLIVLQTRNLRGYERVEKKKDLDRLSGQYPVLLEGGAVGAFGIGAGPVFKMKSYEDLADFPKGAILVAPHTSSRFVSVMDKAAAIVTDVGSATGHMAILAREFHVPTLVDTEKATRVLETGQEVTVDSFNARVYAGRVEPLLSGLPKEDSLFLNTPVFERLQEVVRYIAPLNLVDPKLENFNPRSCQTFHDIIRFAHEKSIEEMFKLSEREDFQKLSAFRIKTHLPLNLYLLDLGGGLKKDGSHRSFPPEKVISIPFKALWKGVTSPGIRWAGPIGVDVKGLLSVMAQSATQPSGDFWDRTLALVSRNYLNFSSRLGYHFATVDSYCGPVRNNNYITFVFKGGAADTVRRGRRARFIGAVLEDLGFEVMIKEDLVKGEYRKYPEPMTEEKLEYLGRLMGCARQLDMVMADENMVAWYARAFLEGNYGFRRENEAVKR
ncbi:MAG: phosphoenolpyruvate synthase [Deltaproteobacteria bacterium]|nr:phosphoenolpyruvate synthase [Deltaproteobacteria bacterium]